MLYTQLKWKVYMLPSIVTDAAPVPTTGGDLIVNYYFIILLTQL